MAFTVKVMRSADSSEDEEDDSSSDDLKPVVGARVVLEFTEFDRGMSNPESTDSDGCAEFSGYDDGNINVYVDGNDEGNYEYRDGDEVSITI